MHLFNCLEDYKGQPPLVLTIGNFDGVHRGHAAIFRQVQSIAGGQQKTMALTFSNHPSTILKPEHPAPLICTLAHRIRLIEEAGIQELLILPFTKYLAEHSAASFIERLRQHLPFTHLLLGYDATLGRDRQGNPKLMHELGHDWGFHVKYLEEFRYEGHPVSSSRIREQLQLGDLESVETLLGRPYSIFTIDCNVQGLCLPPNGNYAVTVKEGNTVIPTIAKIDQANQLLGLPEIEISSEKPIEIIF